jgi:hypothetical protein
LIAGVRAKRVELLGNSPMDPPLEREAGTVHFASIFSIREAFGYHASRTVPQAITPTILYFHLTLDATFFLIHLFSRLPTRYHTFLTVVAVVIPQALLARDKVCGARVKDYGRTLNTHSRTIS